jgi:hypothetical protein
MTKMIFGALIASIAVGLAGVALAGSPAESAKVRKQRPAKLSVARVHADLTVPPGALTRIVSVPCPPRHRVTGGSISPGVTFVAVDAPTPRREGWSGAVGNPSNRTADWSIDLICVRGANRFQRVVRGRQFVAQKRQYRQLKRAMAAGLRDR